MLREINHHSSSNMNNRILDRSNYERKTLDTYEILGAYFVDIYYNHLYNEGKKMRSANKVGTITEGFKHALQAFSAGIDKPRLYKKALSNLHTYYVSIGLSISFSQCIERIAREFIPDMYYHSVSEEQKKRVLRIVIADANKRFIEELVTKYLPLVIDAHDDVDNIRVLQDCFIDILIIERELWSHKFLAPKRAGTSVDKSLMETMQKEIKTLYKEKYELKLAQNVLKKTILEQQDTIKGLKKDINDLNFYINELKNEIPTVRAPQRELLHTPQVPRGPPQQVPIEPTIKALAELVVEPQQSLNINEYENEEGEDSLLEDINHIPEKPPTFLLDSYDWE